MKSPEIISSLLVAVTMISGGTKSAVEGKNNINNDDAQNSEHKIELTQNNLSGTNIIISGIDSNVEIQPKTEKKDETNWIYYQTSGPGCSYNAGEDGPIIILLGGSRLKRVRLNLGDCSATDTDDGGIGDKNDYIDIWFFDPNYRDPRLPAECETSGSCL